jgi:hypothetical protein
MEALAVCWRSRRRSPAEDAPIEYLKNENRSFEGCAPAASANSSIASIDSVESVEYLSHLS